MCRQLRYSGPRLIWVSIFCWHFLQIWCFYVLFATTRLEKNTQGVLALFWLWSLEPLLTQPWIRFGYSRVVCEVPHLAAEAAPPSVRLHPPVCGVPQPRDSTPRPQHSWKNTVVFAKFESNFFELWIVQLLVLCSFLCCEIEFLGVGVNCFRKEFLGIARVWHPYHTEFETNSQEWIGFFETRQHLAEKSWYFLLVLVRKYSCLCPIRKHFCHMIP